MDLITYAVLKKKIGDTGGGITPEQAAQIEQNKEDINSLRSDKADAVQVSKETSTSKEIQPNVFYIWGEVASLDITLASPSDTNTVNEYMFQFVSGEAAATLTLPDSVKWAEQPLIEPNSTYQVSIVNNIGLMIGVGNA